MKLLAIKGEELECVRFFFFKFYSFTHSIIILIFFSLSLSGAWHVES